MNTNIKTIFTSFAIVCLLLACGDDEMLPEITPIDYPKKYVLTGLSLNV